ncbi:helix-turn-helix transcriptional regulator [Actinomycetospora sp. CA-101289]|uniref:helix-turn-helix transcriptional regulator n=1 Tax=Actinomycetospora sp. CA-101289 TaxID=3239893 RepID=UPI003D99E1F5
MTEGGSRAVRGAAATSFVGRDREMAALHARCAAERLVTLVGPGGSGKTRLVLETLPGLATDVVGVVELAACAPSDDLWSVVLDACGIRDDPALTPPARFAHRVGDLDALLVLDNCEHVRDAAADAAVELLAACPRLRVLTTSRVPLGLPEEAVLPVDGLAADVAAALFLDRARRVRPALAPDEEADRIARGVAVALDGLPLAVELAAAHARGLSLRAIGEAMTDRLAFVAGGRRAPRHRSLEACLAWSTALLGERARTALAALSVIEGRCSLAAAVAVVGPPRTAGEPGALAVVEELVDHSLVRLLPGDEGYLVLETVREHARGIAPDEAPPARARLGAWVRALAADARAALERGDPEVLARLDGDAAAVRAVLGHGAAGDLAGIVADLAFWWSLRGRCREGRTWAARVAAASGEAGERPGSRLRWAHAFHAVYSGDLAEGLGLAAAVAEDPAADEETRARAMILLGMAQAFDDPGGADPVLAAAAELAGRAGDRWGRAEALQCLAYAHLWRGDHGAGVACADAARPAVDALGHPQLRAWDGAIRAEAAAQRGDVATALDHGRDAHALAVGIGEPVSATGALLPAVRALCRTGRAAEAGALVERHAAFLDEHPGLGTAEMVALGGAEAALWAGAPAEAAALAGPLLGCADEGLTLVAAEAGAVLAVALLVAGEDARAAEAAALAAARAGERGAREFVVLAGLAHAAARRRQGDDVTADAHDALATAHGAGLGLLVLDALELVAVVALDAGRAETAVRLHAAVDAAQRARGLRPSPLAGTVLAGTVLAGSALDDPAHDAARADGAALDVDAAVALARRARGARGRPRSGWGSLTPTERDVVALAARGLRNQAIADELLMGTGTVRTHLRRIFTKLDLTSRAELAALATRQGM